MEEGYSDTLGYSLIYQASDQSGILINQGVYLHHGGGGGGCCSILLVSGVVFSQSPHLRIQTKPSTQSCWPDQTSRKPLLYQHFNIKYKQTSWSFSPIRQRFSAASQNRRQAGQDVSGCQPGSGGGRRGRRNNRQGTEFPGGSKVRTLLPSNNLYRSMSLFSIYVS